MNYVPKFNIFSTTLKNIIWWFAVATSTVGAALKTTFNINLIAGIIAGVTILLVFFFVSFLILKYKALILKYKALILKYKALILKYKALILKYKALVLKYEAMKKISNSAGHVHNLTHNLRKKIGGPCKLIWPTDFPQVDQHIKDVLRIILDDAANCMSDITGHKIISCLLIPQFKGNEPIKFKTILYGGGPSEERKKGTKTHEEGIIRETYKHRQPYIYNNLMQDFNRDYCKPSRDDWSEHYNSAMMTSFKTITVNGDEKVWGVLSFDCLEKNVFNKEWQYMACAFSDALGLVLSLHDPYSGGELKGDG